MCSLSPLDIEVMKRLGSRVNLIPVIAKADTLTPNDLAAFKKRVRVQLEREFNLFTPKLTICLVR